MHGNILRAWRPRKKFRHTKRHHAATLRAFAAGRTLLDLPLNVTTQAQAVRTFASSTAYVVAATTVLRAGNQRLIDQVLHGHIPLLEAAKLVRKRVKLVQAYRDADAADRIALGKTVGVDRVFDEAIAPSL